MTFPIYRKHFSCKNFYIISNTNHIIEFQLIGRKVVKHEITVKNYFDKIMLNDLINCQNPYIECKQQDIEKLLTPSQIS